MAIKRKSEGNYTEESPASKEDLERIANIMFFVVIVLLVGFATTFVAASAMLIDSWRSKQASYQQLELQVQQLNDKLPKQ